MMIFSEVYGNYYNTVAAILDEAIDKPVSSAEIQKIVNEKAFADSIFTIPKELSDDGKWPLLKRDGSTIIKKKTYMPLTILEKRWLKSLLLDPRIALFAPSQEGLEDVEPLFYPEDIVFFDQFSDGDPYEDEKYIKNFRTILSAVRNKSSVKILYQLKNGAERWIECNPIRIEYSLRDDKFRLISVMNSRMTTMNLAKITKCEVTGTFHADDIEEEAYNKRTVEILLKDERQTLERVMMQFSIYEKITEKVGEDRYRITLTYESEDETDILIRILSFGPTLKVIGPESFVAQIKRRLEMQKGCGH